MYEFTDRLVLITGDDGKAVFEKTVAAPPEWSDTAVSIVASKYLTENETSIEQLFDRVVNAIADKGEELGYFEDSDLFVSKQNFIDCLYNILYFQKASFNSPVWFNVGRYEKALASACFITNIEDDMTSIMEFANLEAEIFRHGGGLGGSLSNLRPKTGKLSGGGTPSGPVSFMEIYDSVAGIVKSGGKTRRAALMLELSVRHPDILDFIRCKRIEEGKARALEAAGLDVSVKFQNANISVQVDDDFMAQLEVDGKYSLYDGTMLKAKEVFDEICECAWDCGDPGIQFIDTINKAHTCPASGQITSSNPCGEFVFLDNSACNLASINLLKFCGGLQFDFDGFKRTIEVLIVAQDILVDLAEYPSEKIAEISRKFRPLGLGYTNLGACLIKRGYKYGSDNAVNFTKRITERLHKYAIETSETLANELGPFEGFEENADYVLSRLRAAAVYHPETARNAQLTLLAPTGTISFMMDCDTFGIEPEFSLVKYKRLVGGGIIKTLNKEAEEFLRRHDLLGAIEDLKETGKLGNVPQEIKDTLCTAMDGLTWKDHVRMMAAAQPFLNGAISKTINLPKEATPDDIGQVILAGFKAGLKSVTVYRDGSKGCQPLSTGVAAAVTSPIPTGRVRMPDTRQALTHKFVIGGHEGYLTVGLYEDGKPGEVFISMSKEGSTLSGLLAAFSISISLGLQCGVDLQTYVEKFSHSKFEPAGITKNKDIRFAHSIIDYVFRWLELQFSEKKEKKPVVSGEICQECGALMQRVGACYLCSNCGTSGGCS